MFASQKKIVILVILSFLLLVGSFIYLVNVAIAPVTSEGVAKTIEDVPYLNGLFSSLDAKGEIRYYVYRNPLRSRCILLSGKISSGRYHDFFNERNGWNKNFVDGIENYFNMRLNYFNLTLKDFNINVYDTEFFFFKEENVSKQERCLNSLNIIKAIYNEKQQMFFIAVDIYYGGLD